MKKFQIDRSKKELTQRIFNDISDGVLAIDTDGTIIYLNPAAQSILDLDESYIGTKYSKRILEDPINDDFHEMLLKAAGNTKKVHNRKIDYHKKDGSKLILEISSSFVYGEDGRTKEGVTIVFSDITQEELLDRKVHDSAVAFIVLLTGVCVWNFLYALWEFLGYPIHVNIMTDILLVLSGIMLYFYKSNSSLDIKDLGLSTENLKRNLLVGVLISAVGFSILCLYKLFLINASPDFFPPDRPFIDIGRLTWEEFTYIISVVWQEFVARGVVHESLRRIIPGKHAEGFALLLSSLFFGAIHIHVGIHYMVGAAVLLGALGFIYIRQNSIWGTCIPHYFLGISLIILSLV